jgi:DNA-binding YbaB/EbfC family protein
MAGVGKLLKQAQKMQKQIETMQTSLETQVIDVSSGGGAVQIKINGAGKFLSFKLDPEFLKEDAKFIEETLLQATQEAAAKAKTLNESEMQKISAAFQMPGMF